MKTLIIIVLAFFANNLIAQTNGCNEEEVKRIDEVKFDIAHSLIDAKTVEATMEDGTEITGFYVDGKLVKMSVTTLHFLEEIYIEDGFPICFEVTTLTTGIAQHDHYYFKDNMLVCREDPMTGVKSGPPDEPLTDLLVGYEIYLEAIQ